MILKSVDTEKAYHVTWTAIRAWATAICYEDLSRIKVKRLGVILFEDEFGNKLIRSIASEIQKTA